MPLSTRGAWMRIEWRVTAHVTLTDGDSVPCQVALVAARPAD